MTLYVAARHQRMARLDGDQPTEPMPEHKHRPHPQCPAGDVAEAANPADGVAIEGPEVVPIRVSRQPRVQHADHREGDENPAVGTILAFARAQIAAAEHSRAGQREGYDRNGNQGGVGEEGGKPAPAKDGKAEKNSVATTLMNASRSVVFTAVSQETGFALCVAFAVIAGLVRPSAVSLCRY